MRFGSGEGMVFRYPCAGVVYNLPSIDVPASGPGAEAAESEKGDV